MRPIAFCLLVVSSVNLPAQDFHPELNAWGASMLLQAKAASFSLFATKQESNVIFYCNLARQDGMLFVKTILLPYLQSKGETDLNDPYINSLIADLNKLPRLKPLRSSQLLTRMAKDYATSSGKAGIYGHSNFDQRFSSLYRSGKTVGENCAYHQENALDAVIDLLIDDGIESLGSK